MSRKQPRARITEIQRDDLGRESLPLVAESTPYINPTDDIGFQQAVEQHKRQLIEKRLQTHGQNIAETARSLGLDRGNLYRMIKRMEIQ